MTNLTPTVQAPVWRSLRTLSLGLALTTLVALPPLSHAGPPPWSNAPFSYYADKKPLRKVLQEFATSFNLSADLPNEMNDSVSGRFNVNNPNEFIDRLAGTFGFSWFTYSGTLYVAHNKDTVVRSIMTNNSGSNNNLRQMMNNLGLLEPRFGWAEMPEQGVVVVSGPPAYVRMIESTITSLPSAPGGQQIAIFRLKHAAVEDRTISYRDKTVTTVGVANILRSLVMGGTATVNGRSLAIPGNNPFANDVPSNDGSNSNRSANASNSPPANVSTTSPSPTSRIRPSIQSDSRINAIIVQDSPDRIPMYKQLIAELDVPTPQIEIEALIIDVNSNRLAEMGISWNGVTNNQRLAIGMGNVNTPVTPNTISFVAGGSGSSVTPSTIIADGTNYFVSRLRALEQTGDASIQSRPSILTTENQGAVIDLSETFYLQTTSERSTLVTPITAGTTLRVTPRLVGTSEEPMVRLSVDIEDGQLKANTTGSPPTVVRGSVSTEASVYKHESLLIGGYNTVQTSKGADKVPLMGDIPLFGAFFRSTSEQTQRRERLFLIRAKVLRSSSPETEVSTAPAPQRAPLPSLSAPVAVNPSASSIAPVLPPVSEASSPSVPPKPRVFDVNTRTEPVATPAASTDNKGMGYILSSGAATAVALPSTSNTANASGNASNATSNATGNTNGMWQMVVSESAQKERDRQMRQILTTEMRQAEDDLQKLVTSSQTEKDPQRLQEMKLQMNRKRADIAGVKRELARLQASAP
jgi:type III secretion protein C